MVGAYRPIQVDDIIVIPYAETYEFEKKMTAVLSRHLVSLFVDLWNFSEGQQPRLFAQLSVAQNKEKPSKSVLTLNDSMMVKKHRT